MTTVGELLGTNWPPTPNCDALPTLITAISNIADMIVNQTPVAIETGTRVTYYGTTELDGVDDGWILCDGRAVSRVTFANLFSAIGTEYGVGDGSTTFNVPDIRGRASMGRDNIGGISADVMTNPNADDMGGIGGTEFHTLTIAEMPRHAHGGVFTGTLIVGGGANSFAASTGGRAAMVVNGNDEPHRNDQPWFAADVYIKT